MSCHVHRKYHQLLQSDLYQLFLLSAYKFSAYNLRLYVSVHQDRSVMPCSQIVPSTPSVRSVSTVISNFYCQHTSSLPLTSDFIFQFIKTEVSCRVHREYHQLLQSDLYQLLSTVSIVSTQFLDLRPQTLCFS